MSEYKEVLINGEQITNYICDKLRLVLKDPNTERADIENNWIYADAPRIDITGYPRIGVEYRSSRNVPIDVGYNWEQKSHIISIIILVKKNTHYKIQLDDETEIEVNEQKLANYLSRRIAVYFKAHESEMRAEGLTIVLDDQNKNDTGVGYKYIDDYEITVFARKDAEEYIKIGE